MDQTTDLEEQIRENIIQNLIHEFGYTREKLEQTDFSRIIAAEKRRYLRDRRG